MSLLADLHPRQKPLLATLVFLATAAFGALILWRAWNYFPPARERLTIFQVSHGDFWIDDAPNRRGALRPNFSGHRLTVRTAGGPVTLRLTGPLPIFLETAAPATFTVRANLDSATMLEITSPGRTHLAYADAAASARGQAGKEAVFGLFLLGLAFILYWAKGSPR